MSRTLHGVSQRPDEALRDAIRTRGPIPFVEFMERSLYGPGGFYDEPPVGAEGHFVTSPHVHPVFGVLLAGGLREMWSLLGKPQPFDVVELGAGDGTLARQILEELSDLPVRYTAVERSPGARARLSDLSLTVLSSLDALDAQVVGCVVANELLDNLPFRWFRGTPGGTAEVWVDVRDDRFLAVDRRCEGDDEGVAGPLQLAPGEQAAVSDAALDVIDGIARALNRGYALFIDYATTGDTPVEVHGYRRHRVIVDVLDEPGSADITAAVDLQPLIDRARRLGLEAFEPMTQRSALRALGLGRWDERERKRQGDLLRRQGAGRAAVRAFASRSRASVLADPAGLGGLRWLLLATRGLEWQRWEVEGARLEARALLVDVADDEEDAAEDGDEVRQ